MTTPEREELEKIRNMFAGQAILVYISRYILEEAVEHSFDLADAMIEEMLKRQKQRLHGANLKKEKTDE